MRMVYKSTKELLYFTITFGFDKWLEDSLTFYIDIYR